MSFSLDQALAGFSRCRFAHVPTPLEYLPHLSKYGGGKDIYVKRDDATGLAIGGNKTRKLEFIIGDALDKGADTLITNGGPQSNHVRQTAAAAAKLGLRCVLLIDPVLQNPGAEYLNTGNILLSRLVGAEVRMLESGENLGEQMECVAKEVRSAGGNPFVIPVGGSVPLGSLGYVDCAREILLQADQLGIEVTHIVHATGSCGTQAGLIAGFHALGKDMEVIGIAVGPDNNQAFRTARVSQLASETLRLLGQDVPDVSAKVTVLGGYHAGGYGQVDDQTLDAVHRVAREEGLLLDPVYTGKAMAGLLDLAGKGYFDKGSNVVFLHTGGSPALFAYREQFQLYREKLED